MIKALDNQLGNSEPSVFAKIPFTSYLVAQKKSGKTTLLLNLLKNKEIYKGKFNQIKWFSPTAQFDSKVMDLFDEKDLTVENKVLKKLQEKEKLKTKILEEEEPDSNYEGFEMYEKLGIEYLKEIIKDQKQIIEKYGKDNADDVLLVMDDCITDKILKSTPFIDFCFKSRHYRISVFFISQSYFSLPKPLRLNNSQVIIFGTGNMKELNSIFHENGGTLSWYEFKEIYQDAIKKDYNFFNILFDNPKKYRYADGISEFYILE